jgi:hypothetical protein
MTLSVTNCHYTECCCALFFVVLIVVTRSFLCWVLCLICSHAECDILCIIKLTVVILSFILLSVTFCLLICLMLLCWVSRFILFYADCCYIEFHSAECRVLFINMLNVVMLSVAFYFILSWLLLYWVSFCWVSRFVC